MMNMKAVSGESEEGERKGGGRGMGRGEGEEGEQLTKLEICICGADVIECAHEAFKDEGCSHCLVNAIELRETVGLMGGREGRRERGSERGGGRGGVR